MFYLTTHSTHFIYGYMASDISLRTILIVREETRCRHIGYSFRLAARVLLYAHPTDRIAHTTAFVTPVVEHWLEREISQCLHPMKDRSDDLSHHERTLLPRSYISLLVQQLPDKHKSGFNIPSLSQHHAMLEKTRTHPGARTNPIIMLYSFQRMHHPFPIIVTCFSQHYSAQMFNDCVRDGTN